MRKEVFGDLYDIPSRNGVSRPSRVRGSGFKMINMGELFANDRICDIEMELVPLNEKEQNNFEVKPFDLLFARQSIVAEGAGKCSIVMEVGLDTTCFESHIIRVRLNEEKAFPLFYYYFFQSQLGKGYLSSIRQQGVQAGIRGSELALLKLPYFTLSEQPKIASILSAYDDLIENNLKRIQLLEEKAQLTYEEWFVRMKFPGHETTTINKETGLPLGWEKVKASEKIKLISGYAFKGKEFTDDPNEHIAIRMGNFKVGGGLKTVKSKYLVDHTSVREKFHLSHNDLVMVLSDVTREGLLIGNVGFVPNDGRNYYLNQRVSKVELDDNFKMYAYATFNSQSFKHNCVAKANSVTVLNLKNDDVYGYKMLIPAQEIIDLWNSNYGATIQTTQNLERQNQFLQEARGILLPRLMTGMINVEQMKIETLQPTTA